MSFHWIPFFFTKEKYVKKRGYKDYKKYRKSQGITTTPSDADYDFQQYVIEFEKLLNKKFYIRVSNGQVIEFCFQKGNFFHLLGFHKFENTIFKKMIEDDAIDYKASDFYDDVYSGYINYTKCDFDKIKIPKNLNIDNFQLFYEHIKNSSIQDVLMRRFPYFTYDHIIKILHNKVIVDFDKDSFEGEIRANKVLFCFLDITQKNLNLFLDNDDDGYFVTSFFLENKANYYKKKKDGSLMEELEVSCLYIKDLQDSTEHEFEVYWEVVNSYVIEFYNIVEYNEMKKVYNKRDITAIFLETQLVEINNKIENIDSTIYELDEKIKIVNLKIDYLTVNEISKDEITLQLMDFNIDTDLIVENLDTVKSEQKKLIAEIKQLNESKKRLLKKSEKTEKAIPNIQKLEILKVKTVYEALIENSQYWKEDFWLYFVKTSDCFTKSISPKEVKEIYLKYSKNN